MFEIFIVFRIHILYSYLSFYHTDLLMDVKKMNLHEN